jgi:hypothetical protein
MKRTIAGGMYVVVTGLTLLATGCATYYQVTDPASGRVYYTDKITSERGGAVKLQDARTNASVTLQNSEVKEISKDEYKAGISKPVTAPPPAAPAAPAEATPAAPTQPATTPPEGTESK